VFAEACAQDLSELARIHVELTRKMFQDDHVVAFLCPKEVRIISQAETMRKSIGD
jgi:hypothetical protein